MRVKHPPTAAPVPSPEEDFPTAELRLEAAILNAQALSIRVLAIHLALVKRYAGTQPALRQESDLLVPLLTELQNTLGCGWAANESVATALAGTVPPPETRPLVDLLHRLAQPGDWQAAVGAWLAEQAPRAGGVPA